MVNIWYIHLISYNIIYRVNILDIWDGISRFYILYHGYNLWLNCAATNRPAQRRSSRESIARTYRLERRSGAAAQSSLRTHIAPTLRCSLPTVTNPLNDDEMMIPSWLAHWVETSSILEVQTDKDMSMEVGAVGDHLCLNFSVSMNFCPLLGATVPSTWNITPSFGIDPLQYWSFL